MPAGGTVVTPDLMVPLDSMNLVVGALRWLNADENVEASLTMEEIPDRDWDAIVELTSTFLEQARRRRQWNEARAERAPRVDEPPIIAAIETVMRGGGWISGTCRH